LYVYKKGIFTIQGRLKVFKGLGADLALFIGIISPAVILVLV